MPSALASRGPCTWTGLPSKVYSPSSKAWIPAIPLIRVLLPAPLSPTSAVTWPARTSRSTPRSTCTAPKLFWMLRRLSSGVLASAPGEGARASAVMRVLSMEPGRDDRGGRVRRPGRPRGPTGPSKASADTGRLAGSSNLTRADVGDGLVAVVEDLLHVVDGHPHRGGQGRRNFLARVGVGHGARGQCGRALGVAL